MPFFESASQFNIYGGTFTEVHGDPDTLKAIKEILEDEERRKILAWVSPMDFYAKHFDISEKRQPGTGEWLFQSEEFQTWERGTGQALWCSGIPGAGKTVLASFVIDHLYDLQRREPFGTIGVAWFYYNYKEESTQTPDTLQLSLIRQLGVFSDELYTILRSVYNRDPAISRPTGRYLVPDMRALAKAFSASRVFIVIDALDECASRNRDKILHILSGLQCIGANILITSRDNVKESIVDSGLTDLRRLYILGNTNDIVKYVKAQLVKQRRLDRIFRLQPSLRDDIVGTIVDVCQGMFLMATFQVNSLGQYLNAGQIRDALKRLPTTFRGIYDEAIYRIEKDDHSVDALRVLSFLIHARRPLTVTELQHFLAITPGNTEFRDDYITDKDILVSICAGLIVIDDKTAIVRLVHFTAQEYFDQIRASKFPNGDQVMGQACLVYLSFNTFKKTSCLSDALDRRYSLLKYIVHYWDDHVRNHQLALETVLKAFLTDNALICAYSSFTSMHNQSYFGRCASENLQDAELRYTGLHVAAAAGLIHAASWLLVENVDANARDPSGRTALIYASERGDADMVNHLLAHGANVAITLVNKRTALDEAVLGGHAVVVRLLLKHYAKAKPRCRLDKEALQIALKVAMDRGYEAVVRTLLEHGADANAPGADKKTMLQTAVWDGQEGIVRALLEHGANANGMGTHTPLYLASYQGSGAIVKLLLNHGANVNPTVEGHSTVLHAAALSSHKASEAIARLLLEHGADVGAHDPWGRTAHDLASSEGHKTVASLLAVPGGSDRETRAGRRRLKKFLPKGFGSEPFSIPAPPVRVQEVSARVNITERLKVSARLMTAFRVLSEYKQLLSCRGDEAQALLETFHLILGMGLSLDHAQWRNLIVAAIRLSSKTRLYPRQFLMDDAWQLDERPFTRGGSANIYRGLSKGGSVCLKVFRVYQGMSYNRLSEMIAREAILWGQLSHPNILPFHGLYHAGPSLFLVSPWAENGNILDFLEANPTTNRVQLCLDIARGVSYLHENEVVHGGLNAENAVVDRSHRARLIGFGGSGVSDPEILRWDQESPAASEGGITGYLVPELLERIDSHKTRYNTKPTDVYGWACTCYEIFIGKPPFFEYHFIDRISKIMSGVRPTRPAALLEKYTARGLTEEIWGLINECWEQDPVDRPTIAEALSRLANGQPIDDRPPGEWKSGLATRKEQLANTSLPLTLDALNAILSREPID